MGSTFLDKKNFSCPCPCKALVFENKVSLTESPYSVFLHLFFCIFFVICHEFFAGLGIRSLVFCVKFFGEQKSERAIHSFEKVNRFFHSF